MSALIDFTPRRYARYLDIVTAGIGKLKDAVAQARRDGLTEAEIDRYIIGPAIQHMKELHRTNERRWTYAIGQKGAA
jgi:hypothetical protein